MRQRRNIPMPPDMMDVDVYVTTSVREFSDIQEEEKKVGPAY